MCDSIETCEIKKEEILYDNIIGSSWLERQSAHISALFTAILRHVYILDRDSTDASLSVLFAKIEKSLGFTFFSSDL